MGRKLSEASRRKREREAFDLEETRRQRQGPPPAPRGPFPNPWSKSAAPVVNTAGPDHVVDPAWVTAHGGDREAIPEPFAAIANLDVEHVHRALDPDIFPDGNGYIKRRLHRDEKDGPARDVGSAFDDFLETIAPADTTNMDALMLAHGVAIKSLVLAIRRAVERALADAEEERDQVAITRGFWEHHIARLAAYSSDVTPEEMLDQGLSNMDTVTRAQFLAEMDR